VKADSTTERCFS